MSEILWEAFPQYLAMGMTAQEYWEGDCRLAKSYYEAYLIREEQRNYDAWRNGLYTYTALCDVAPILRAFVRSGTAPRSYPSKPYSLKGEEEKPKPKRTEDGQELSKRADIAAMQAMVAAFNRQFRKKKAEQQAKLQSGKPQSLDQQAGGEQSG